MKESTQHKNIMQEGYTGPCVRSQLEDSNANVRCEGLRTLGSVTFPSNQLRHPAALAQHADYVVAMLDDSVRFVRSNALVTLGKLEPATLAQYANAVVARLEDSELSMRHQAMCTLGKLEPAILAQHAHAVLARLEVVEGYDWRVRHLALKTLGKLAPATLAQHTDAVVARLSDSNEWVRCMAIRTLGKLDPATFAQHADAVVARLEDSHVHVRREALTTLDKLEPATLAQYAGAVVAKLSVHGERRWALLTLSKVPPTTLAQHAGDVIDTWLKSYSHDARYDSDPDDWSSQQYDQSDDDTYVHLGVLALRVIRALPSFVTRDVDFESDNVRSRLLARLRWYRYAQRLPVQRIALYWYQLPYRPSGPGHARDVEAWGQMID